MAEICYISKKFNADARHMIHHADVICREFRAQGLDVTLRQLYYQFVARDWFPAGRTFAQTASGKWVRSESPDATTNADPNYKWLGGIINDARMAGWLDWDFVVDRTRNIRQLATWASPTELIEACAAQYRTDRWAQQDTRVEVWIEKDALVGILQQACPELHVPYFSCRGYTSQSEMWSAAQRLRSHIEQEQNVVIVHLGDHDPSGIDMTRDIRERLAGFLAQDLGLADAEEGAEVCEYELGEKFEVRRVALNMDQIRMYQPPPNPAKLSDSRGADYVERYGNHSWELDALNPATLRELIQEAVFDVRDDVVWDESTEAEENDRSGLKAASKHWPEVHDFAVALPDPPEDDEGE